MAARAHKSLSDKELVTAFQAGERSAYDEMFRRYSERVRRTCGRVLSNSQDAEEAAQETFFKAYQALPRFNGSYQLGAWLCRIAVNVSIDHVRSKGRHPTLVPLPEQPAEPVASGPEDAIAESRPQVTEALAELQPLHARALKLRAIHGLSHREMAGRLEMSPEQVKALLHRARRSFKRAWDEASSWALAPVFALRALFSSRTNEVSHVGAVGAPNFAAMSNSVMPVVEKAVASAVIVAAALSGIPSAPGGTGSAPIEVTAPAPKVQARDDAAAPTVLAAGATHEITEADAVADLLKLAEKTTQSGNEPPEQESPEDPEEPSGGGGGGDDPLGGAGAKQAQQSARQVKKAVRELIDP